MTNIDAIKGNIEQNQEAIGAAGDVIVEQFAKTLPAAARLKVYQAAKTASGWVAGVAAVVTAAAVILAVFYPQVGAIVGASGGLLTIASSLVNRWVAKLAANNVTPGT